MFHSLWDRQRNDDDKQFVRSVSSYHLSLTDVYCLNLFQSPPGSSSGPYTVASPAYTWLSRETRTVHGYDRFPVKLCTHLWIGIIQWYWCLDQCTFSIKLRKYLTENGILLIPCNIIGGYLTWHYCASIFHHRWVFSLNHLVRICVYVTDSFILRTLGVTNVS